MFRKFNFLMILIILLLVACEDDNTATSDNQSPTDIPRDIEWQAPDRELTAENIHRITMTGRVGGHSTEVVTIRFSPDMNRLASMSTADNRINIRDMASGELIDTLDNTTTRWLYWGHDNTHLITVDLDWMVYEWNLVTDEATSFDTGLELIGIVQQSDNRQRLVLGDVEGNMRLFSLNPLTDRGILAGVHSGQVDDIQFLPDNERFISMNRNNREIIVWDFATQTQLHRFDIDEPFYEMAVSLNGQFMAVSFVNKVDVWRLDNYTQHESFFTPDNTASENLMFLENNNYIVSSSENLIGIWDVTGGDLAVGIELDNNVNQLEANDNLLFASAIGNRSIFIWDLRPLETREQASGRINLPRSTYQPLTENIELMAIAPDQRVLVVVDGTNDLYFFTVQAE